MARPAPTVLATVLNRKTYWELQVLDADYLYAVQYDGHAIGIRYDADTYWKYHSTTSVSKGTMKRLARRLNKQFQTDKFTVVRLSP